MTARFSNDHCSKCPHREYCPVKPLKKGDYSLRYTEATESHLKSDCGAGRIRVRGLPQVRCAVILKALGLNIFRSAKALKHAYKSLFLLFLGHVAVRKIHKPEFRHVPHANDLLSYFFCQRTIYLWR